MTTREISPWYRSHTPGLRQRAKGVAGVRSLLWEKEALGEMVELSVLAPHLVVLDVVNHVCVWSLPRCCASVVVDIVDATSLVYTPLPAARTSTHQVSLNSLIQQVYVINGRAHHITKRLA